ncbi:unnamed protein product [Paramecium sonneborni]|uniref:Tetratricopeptide repeat protein n=1 Tax=Paramecium sonneborni TaxID=65129 RepID=A0A8S1QW39_9CILI|nr:unnamed protein product [Paramecium sonneborni]
MNKCLQCKRGEIAYWCMERQSKKLICEGCSIRNYNIVKVSNSADIEKLLKKIKVWTTKAIKNIMQCAKRIFEYQYQIEDKFNQFRNNLVELQNKFYPIYFKYLEFYPKVDLAILNLNNMLESYNSNNSSSILQTKDDQINLCKNLIKSKEIIKAQQEIQNLQTHDNYNSKYFQIECLLLQKNLKEASQESQIITDAALNETIDQIDENLLCNLLIQKAKIKHKQGLYQQALEILKNIERDSILPLNQKRIDLQISKSLLKSGNFQIGFNLLQLTIQDLSQLEQESEQNKYLIDNYSFRLAYAKAKLSYSESSLSRIRILHDLSFSQQYNEDSPIIENGNQNESVTLEEIQNSQYDEIKQLYEEILKKEPNNQKALYGLSQIYIKQSSTNDSDTAKQKLKMAKQTLFKLNQLNPLYKKAEIALLFCKQKMKSLEEVQNSNRQCRNGCILGCLLGSCYRILNYWPSPRQNVE